MRLSRFLPAFLVGLLAWGVSEVLAGPGPGGAAAVPAVSAMTASSPPDLTFGLPPGLNYVLLTLGFGGLAGWSVGFTMKKFAKMAALVVGVTFIAIQILASRHFLTVDWEKVGTLMPKDGGQQLYVGLMSILTYNFPFAGSFILGFWMGFRKG